MGECPGVTSHRSRALYNTHVHSSFPSRICLREAGALTDMEDTVPTRWSGSKIAYTNLRIHF